MIVSEELLMKENLVSTILLSPEQSSQSPH
jgi:hypothetical protein